MIDRAIDDDDTVLRLDPTLADIFNARGELWRKKGDRPKALQDFGAAIRLNPNHPLAKANYKSLALELERLGALLAVNNKPSFNCATAKARGGEGDLRQSGTGQSRPPDQRGEQPRGQRRGPRPIRAPAAPCSASRTILSRGAMPASASRITTCKRRCASGSIICWRSGISRRETLTSRRASGAIAFEPLGWLSDTITKSRALAARDRIISKSPSCDH